MSDEVQLQWRVTSMDCYPEYSGLKNYVFNVHWDCLSYYSGVSGGPFYGRSFSLTSIESTNIGEFTPYTGLQESQVLSWIWDTVGSGVKYNYEQISSSQIYNQLVPPVVRLPLPWIENIFSNITGSN
jgi:hypothetical protein